MQPSDPGVPNERSAEASRANFLAQIEELDRDNAFLRERLQTYRERLDATTSRLNTMSRVARIWMLIRYTVRRPWTAPRFPGELARIARNVPAAGVPPRPERSTPEELAALRGAAARAAGATRFEIRTSRSGAIRQLADLRVAAVADSWLLDALEPECRLVPLRPETWRATLEACPPDLLLVHSAWHGRGGAWQYRLAASPFPDAIRRDAIHLISAWCSERDIPRVLWDTEPRERWRRFRDLAVLVDHVVAADGASVDAYRAWMPRSAFTVDRLPIGIQPRIHHPDTDAAGDPGQAAFIGSVAADVSLDRREALERLVLAGANRGAAIHDRAGQTEPERFALPAGVEASVALRVPGEDLGPLYRHHRPVLLNGSGPRPDAVVPRSILEAMACGAPVVTTPSPAIEEVLGGLTYQADGIAEIEASIEVASSPEARARAAADGVARIMADHRIDARLERICEIAGVPVQRGGDPPSVLALLDEWPDVARLAASLGHLGPAPFDLVLGADSFDLARLKATTIATEAWSGHPRRPVRMVVVEAALGRGERLRRLAAAADGSWVAILGPAIADDPDAVRDWLARVHFTGSDAIGWPRGRESGDRAVVAIDPVAGVVRRAALLANGWPDGATGGPGGFSGWTAGGRRLHAFMRSAPPGPERRPVAGDRA
ncbi:MAG TPA: glycosyltransferase [Patescibacteria group bacterium]|nr:glycosyltransferase [Patescibacteria group bacterium]